MRNSFTTERLSLYPLTLNEADFILELVNTPGWIKFIGDRKVNNFNDARSYIKKIRKNPGIKYWVVKLKKEEVAIGIVTLIKREYLAYHDIGFAFLPGHAKMGYAIEAASALLSYVKKEYELDQLLATTVKDNTNSINLLNKLGFEFDREIVIDNQSLLVYSLEIEE